MAWYMAKSLEVLRGQLNTLAPRRSKVSDGGIGDAAHSARTSDHNPISGTGQVCARDFTHDPAGGLDCHWLARVLIGSSDGRIKYIIWDRRIWTPGVGWRAYNGSNPHTKHLHLSVRAGAVGDGTQTWNLGTATAPDQEDEMFTADDFNRFMWGNVFDDPTKRNFAAYIKDMGGQVAGLTVALQAQTKLIVANELNDITPANLAAALEGLLVAKVGPVVRQEVADALDDDNAEQADAIADRVLARIVDKLKADAA